jgi:hypothetical protein
MSNRSLYCTVLFLLLLQHFTAGAQEPLPPFQDSLQPLRIINLSPYFTQHSDSALSYKFEINRNPAGYYWYLKNAPAGIRIHKDNGTLSYNADKKLFLSGKLKYDTEYTIRLGVQNLVNPLDKQDTGFTISFYNTEIIPSRVKPSVSDVLVVEEGETVSFTLQCENGNFPVEDILFTSNIPVQGYSLVSRCGDEFRWTPDYEFTKPTDKNKERVIVFSFVGSTRFMVRDTAQVRVTVKDALNYPMAVSEHQQVQKNISTYILKLKFAFLQLDKKLKKVKTTRTTFDLTAASSALTGTILSTSSSKGAQNTGKVLPSVGVAMVPIKEAAAPNKNVEQNQASLIRTSIKRLEYMSADNSLTGEKDPLIAEKIKRLKDELKQIQIQLLDVPVEEALNMSEEELNKYFNSPKVNKKYRLKG